jgi:hypothetical protein
VDRQSVDVSNIPRHSTKTTDQTYNSICFDVPFVVLPLLPASDLLTLTPIPFEIITIILTRLDNYDISGGHFSEELYFDPILTTDHATNTSFSHTHIN